MARLGPPHGPPFAYLMRNVEAPTSPDIIRSCRPAPSSVCISHFSPDSARGWKSALPLHPTSAPRGRPAAIGPLSGGSAVTRSDLSRDGNPQPPSSRDSPPSPALPRNSPPSPDSFGGPPISRPDLPSPIHSEAHRFRVCDRTRER